MSINFSHYELSALILSGAFAGLTTDLVLYPLDTLKTRIQSSSCNSYTASKMITTNLYNGIGYALFSAIPSATTFFTVYSTCKMNGTGDWIAAVVGEFASTTVRQPLEVLKQKSQAGFRNNNANTYKSSPFHFFYSFRISHQHFFKGYTMTLMRDLPFAAIQYPLFEHLKPEFGALTAAFTAGFVAGAITTPLDWMKTRIILSTSGRLNLGEIVKSEGFWVIFSGFRQRVLWISIGAAIFLGSFHAMHEFLTMKIMAI